MLLGFRALFVGVAIAVFLSKAGNRDYITNLPDIVNCSLKLDVYLIKLFYLRCTFLTCHAKTTT